MHVVKVFQLEHMYRNKFNVNSGGFPISELILGCVHACEKVLPLLAVLLTDVQPQVNILCLITV